MIQSVSTGNILKLRIHTHDLKTLRFSNSYVNVGVLNLSLFTLSLTVFEITSIFCFLRLCDVSNPWPSNLKILIHFTFECSNPYRVPNFSLLCSISNCFQDNEHFPFFKVMWRFKPMTFKFEEFNNWICECSNP